MSMQGSRIHGLRLVLLSILVPLFCSCTPLATYPPVEGTHFLAPWIAPCPEVMAEGLRYAHVQTGKDEPLIFNLPPGTTMLVWKDVQKRLGDDAEPMSEPGQMTWTVEQVRIRGLKAEVDVGYPDGNTYQLMTVKLKSTAFGKFVPDYVQRWFIPLAEPTPNYPGLDNQGV